MKNKKKVPVEESLSSAHQSHNTRIKQNTQNKRRSKDLSTTSVKSSIRTRVTFVVLSSCLALVTEMLLIELQNKEIGLFDLAEIYATDGFKYSKENKIKGTKGDTLSVLDESEVKLAHKVKEYEKPVVNEPVNVEQPVVNKTASSIEQTVVNEMPINDFQPDKHNTPVKVQQPEITKTPIGQLDISTTPVKADQPIVNNLENVLNVSQEKLAELEKQININEKKDKNENEKIKKTPIRLIDLYTEVEKLTEEILAQDPHNDMVKQLAPHLEGVIQDMNADKVLGIEESLLHIREILLDLKKRLKEVEKDKLHTSSEDKPSKPSSADEGIDYSNRVPVDEVIPEPVYIAPRGVGSEMSEKIDEKLYPKDVKDKVERVEMDIPISEGKTSNQKPKKLTHSKNGQEKVEFQEATKDTRDDNKGILKESKGEVSKNNQGITTNNQEESNPSILQETSQPEKPILKDKKQNEKRVETNERKENLQDEFSKNPKEDGNLGNKVSGQSSDGISDHKTDSTSGEKTSHNEVKADKLQEPNHDAFLTQLQVAQSLITTSPAEAIKSFARLLSEQPHSLEAMLGKAKALDRLADSEQSNTRLEDAIEAYLNVINAFSENPQLVSKDWIIDVAEICAERMIFRGWRKRVISLYKKVIEHFPDEVRVQNRLGRAYLLLMDPQSAKQVFLQVLQKWPDDGFAQAHYGLILKTSENNVNDSIAYLLHGIRSGAEGTVDGRFYLHLGDAYQRIDEDQKANEIFDEAVEKGLFLSRYQRSLYNVDRLKSRPLWTLKETTYEEFFMKLKTHWKEIRDEGLKVLNLKSDKSDKGFELESENLQKSGEWSQFTLFSQGRKNGAKCAMTPFTCTFIQSFPDAANNKRGQTKFSVMKPGTSVYKHTGPTNCRLRAHLGLVTPPGAYMKVVDTLLEWKAGEIFVFDDSFQHEVWHDGNSSRLILIVDVWHPDLTDAEKLSLSPI